MTDMPEDPTAHEAVIDALTAGLKEADLTLPPNCLLEMDGEITRYTEGQSLVVRFPVQERYENPVGVMQGGFIAAAIDNAFGPLSYLVGPPSATTQLSIRYIRPVRPEDAFIEVEASVVEQAGRQLYLQAKVYNPNGKTVAIAEATCRQIPRRSL